LRQKSLAVLATLAAGLLMGAAEARAARVLVFEHGDVRSYDEKALDADLARPEGPMRFHACSVCRVALKQSSLPARASTSRSDPVLRALRRALAAGQIAAADADRYRATYKDALLLRRRLPFQRERELAYVIATLRKIAGAGRLNAGRMPALFLILERNREWWSEKGAPAAGARVRFGDSRVIFQYYPGRGLQLQPLANFGLANGYWQGGKDKQLRSLIDELVALRVTRGGFTTWEYYFDFGGGSPPWVSGMAQATALQALARAGMRFGDPSLVEIGRQGLGAFEHPTPVGARVPTGPGAWYALYSFAPRLEVLNAMLQSLIGLNTYATLTGDARAAALFSQGDQVAQAQIASYDTGAWSLYSRSSGHPGGEANLNYHTLNRDFARTLCRATAAVPYCTAADRFSQYLREDPELRPFGPVPAPAKGGRGVRFYFTLSKIGRVGISVTATNDAGDSERTYLSTSAPFSRGRHFFRWVPLRLKRERTYEYRLSARDLAGNTASESGTIRVKANPTG
jgi:hypothetical protein